MDRLAHRNDAAVQIVIRDIELALNQPPREQACIALMLRFDARYALGRTAGPSPLEK